jgi:hypothetical protein
MAATTHSSHPNSRETLHFARHYLCLAGCLPPCTPTRSFNKLSVCKALLHSITSELQVPSCIHCRTLRTTHCFLFALWATSNQRSDYHALSLPYSAFLDRQIVFTAVLGNLNPITLTAVLQVDASHIFTVDVSYTNSNTDEFYYFYFDGVLAIDRSPAVCLPLGSCNVGTYTVSLLASEFYRFEMR